MSVVVPSLLGPTYPTAIPEDGISSSGLVTVVQALHRHRRLGLTIFFVVLAAAAAITFATQKQYESEMKILVQNARGSLVVTPERTMTTNAISNITEEQVNSELEVLRSREIAEAALTPNWNAAAHTSADNQVHEKALEKFRKHLIITAVRKANIIQIDYTDASPQGAQATMQRVAAAVLSKEREIERPAGASTFFADQASHFKADLEAAQRQLSDLQQKTGVVSLPERETDLDKQIAALQAEQRTTLADAGEKQSRLQATRLLLQSVPERQRTTERSIPYQQSVEQINTLLQQLRNKREELLTKYLPGERLLIENQHQIDSANETLTRLRASNSDEKATDVNPVWQQLSSSEATTSAELHALDGKRKTLDQQIKNSQVELAAIEGKAVPFSAAKQRVAELESDYQLYTQKSDEAQISDAMDEHKMLNVAVAELPTINYIPVRPKPLSNLILSTLTAIFLALGAVFYAEISRATVADARELEAVAPYPVLAIIPLIKPSCSIAAEGSPKGAPSYMSETWSGGTVVASHSRKVS